MSSINVVFQEKGKQNVIMKGNQKMSVSELINAFYKKICASKKEKMTKQFVFQGTELSPEDSTLLSELGMKDYSVVEIHTTEPMAKAPKEQPKIEEPPKEEVVEEPPQEEQPKEEPPQEEVVEEQPHEEPPQEEVVEEQPHEEPPQEEVAQEEVVEEQPQQEPPQEEQQDDDWD